MFERLSYVGYTALFCLPPLILLWLRREFLEVLRPRLRPILLATAALTLYGSAIWPIALDRGAWAYGADRITGLELAGRVLLDDVLWWALVGLLFSSFVALSVEYERRGVDLVSREVRGLARGVADAFRGFRIVPLERNSTIHVAAAVFVLLEAALFRVSATEWMLVALAIGSVLAAEIMNGAVERLASRAAGGGHDPEIRLIKDAAAAAVLVTAFAAGAVGALILLRRVLEALG